MIYDELKAILESDEPSEEFKQWLQRSHEQNTDAPRSKINWLSYQKGLRDAQREPVKVNYEGYYDRCGACMEAVPGMNFCPKCGVELEY